MKGILEFDLNDQDIIKEHIRCVLASNMAIVIWQMHNNAYKKLEREHNPAFNEGIEKTLEHLQDLMKQNGININELID